MAPVEQADPLVVACCDPPRGCAQPPGEGCVSIGVESAGQPLRHPHVCRQVRAGQQLEPTTPAELAGERKRLSETVQGQLRGRAGRRDWAGDGER